jgi:hypothetical protein
VKLQTQGTSIKGVLPTVPYYENLFITLGEYADTEQKFTEAEELALYLVDRLAQSPDNVDRLRNDAGAESKLFDRNVEIGKQGSYLISRRHRGKDILINPVYFSENSEVFADLVAAKGADIVGKVLKTVVPRINPFAEHQADS